MAIIIPSKNIYEINNPKIRDNVIDNVSVDNTIVSPNNEYEVSVYNGKFFAQFSQIQKSDDENETNSLIKSYGVSGSSIGVRAVWIANSGMINKNLYKFTFQIPRLLKNKFISQVFYEKDKEGKNKISYAVYGDIEKGLCSRTATWEYISATSSNVRIVSLGDVIFEEHTEKEEGVLFNQDATIVSTIKGTPNQEYFETQEVVSTLNPNDTSYVAYYNGNDNHFDIEFYVLCMFDTITLGNMYYGGATNGELLLQGEYKRHIPTQIEITVYGNTIGIDLTDGSVTYGSGKHPHSLNANELLQDSAKVGNALLTKHLADNVLTQYKNGKETATLLCDINEYYHYGSDEKAITTNGKVHYPIENITVSDKVVSITKPFKNDLTVVAMVFSPNALETQKTVIKSGETQATFLYGVKEVQKAYFDLPMTFKLHDEVIPMVFGADGKDKPMSKYQDGSPKVFEVTGSNMIYDGAVWQELTLLEKKQEIT